MLHYRSNGILAGVATPGALAGIFKHPLTEAPAHMLESERIACRFCILLSLLVQTATLLGMRFSRSAGHQVLGRGASR